MPGVQRQAAARLEGSALQQGRRCIALAAQVVVAWLYSGVASHQRGTMQQQLQRQQLAFGVCDGECVGVHNNSASVLREPHLSVLSSPDAFHACTVPASVPSSEPNSEPFRILCRGVVLDNCSGPGPWHLAQQQCRTRAPSLQPGQLPGLAPLQCQSHDPLFAALCHEEHRRCPLPHW